MFKTCFRCRERGFCSILCRDMENFLERFQSKNGYSSRWIRRREIPYNHNDIEMLQVYALDRKYGIIHK